MHVIGYGDRVEAGLLRGPRRLGQPPEHRGPVIDAAVRPKVNATPDERHEKTPRIGWRAKIYSPNVCVRRPSRHPLARDPGYRRRGRADRTAGLAAPGLPLAALS